MSTTKSESLPAALQIDWPRTISIVLAIIGIFVAGYLAWAEVTGNETVCADTNTINCAAVQKSAYAETFGFPVAVMGLLGYVAILAVLVLEDQVDILASYGRTLIVAMALFGFIFQSYLALIEATVLEKWCQWCIVSHAVITLLLIIGAYRLYRFLQPLRR